MATQLKVHIRWMIRRDMPEALEIERDVFESPWFEEEFIRCLRQRNVIAMIAERDERVLGFIIYELHKTRLHVLTIAVAKDVQRQGVGRQMIEYLAGKLSARRRTRMSLEVRESALVAQVFFRDCGFKATNVLEGFFDDSAEDAYLMQFVAEEDSFLISTQRSVRHGNNI